MTRAPPLTGEDVALPERPERFRSRLVDAASSSRSVFSSAGGSLGTGDPGGSGSRPPRWRHFTTIERDQPRDQILRVRGAGFDVAPRGGIRVRVGDDWYEPTDFALGQIAARAGIP